MEWIKQVSRTINELNDSWPDDGISHRVRTLGVMFQWSKNVIGTTVRQTKTRARKIFITPQKKRKN